MDVNMHVHGVVNRIRGVSDAGRRGAGCGQ